MFFFRLTWKLKCVREFLCNFKIQFTKFVRSIKYFFLYLISPFNRIQSNIPSFFQKKYFPTLTNSLCNIIRNLSSLHLKIPTNTTMQYLNFPLMLFLTFHAINNRLILNKCNLYTICTIGCISLNLYQI